VRVLHVKEIGHGFGGHQPALGRRQGHLTAVLEVARKRAAEPIMLNDVEVTTTDPLPRLP